MCTPKTENMMITVKVRKTTLKICYPLFTTVFMAIRSPLNLEIIRSGRRARIAFNALKLYTNAIEAALAKNHDLNKSMS